MAAQVLYAEKKPLKMIPSPVKIEIRNRVRKPQQPPKACHQFNRMPEYMEVLKTEPNVSLQNIRPRTRAKRSFDLRNEQLNQDI